MTDKIYLEIGKSLTEDFDISMGQMFGKPCLKTKNKAFLAYYQDEMVFKLGHEEILITKQKYIGSKNWDPSGKKRPMKDWLQIPTEFSFDWKELSIQAMQFVESTL